MSATPVRSLVIALWLGSVALATPVSSASAQDATAFAQDLFTSGVAHYDASEFDAALADFRRSLSLYESPNTRLYLGRTLRELGQLPDAIAELERASREAADRATTDPRYERTRDAGHSEATALAARIGRVTIVAADVPPGAHVTVGGVEVPTAAIGAPIRVMPGEVEIVVEAEGYEVVRRSASVATGETSTVELSFTPVAVASQEVAPVEMTPPPPPPASMPSGPSGLVIAGAVSVGLGGAAAIAAIITGVMTADRYASLETACGPTHVCPAERASDISEGSTLAVTSTALTVGASVVGGLGIVLLVIGALEGPPTETEHVRLVPGPGLAGGGVEWTF